MRVVEPGVRTERDWVIAKGLERGERVVVEGLQKVREGIVVAAKAAGRPSLRQPRPAARAPPAEAKSRDERRPGLDLRADYFFVRRPIVAIVISIVTVLVGVVAMGGLPIAQFPDIVPPEIQLTATYTGADARHHRAVGRDADRAADERRRRHALHAVGQRQRRHDDAARHLRRRHEHRHRQGAGAEPRQRRPSRACPRTCATSASRSRSRPRLRCCSFSLYSPNGTYDDAVPRQLRATSTSTTRSKRVPGVGHVVIFGAGDYAMRIWVKPDQLAQLGLTVPDLVDAIQQAEHREPGGPDRRRAGAGRAGVHLHACAPRAGSSPRRSSATSSCARIPTARIVRLRDVARIELGALNYNQRGRFNGKPAGDHRRLPDRRARTRSRSPAGSSATMEELEAALPGRTSTTRSRSTPRSPVTEGIDEILHTLVEAMVLVILVVFVFLQSWRATLIPLLTVPVSLVGTFAVFPAVRLLDQHALAVRPRARDRPRGRRRDRRGRGGASTTSSTGCRRATRRSRR